MASRRKKMTATVLIIVVSVIAFVAFMFIQVSNDKATHGYIAILFGILPALMINAVWNKRKRKRKNN
jgi:hypothetical protein